MMVSMICSLFNRFNHYMYCPMVPCLFSFDKNEFIVILFLSLSHCRKTHIISQTQQSHLCHLSVPLGHIFHSLLVDMVPRETTPNMRHTSNKRHCIWLAHIYKTTVLTISTHIHRLLTFHFIL